MALRPRQAKIKTFSDADLSRHLTRFHHRAPDQKPAQPKDDNARYVLAQRFPRARGHDGLLPLAHIQNRLGDACNLRPEEVRGTSDRPRSDPAAAAQTADEKKLPCWIAGSPAILRRGPFGPVHRAVQIAKRFFQVTHQINPGAILSVMPGDENIIRSSPRTGCKFDSRKRAKPSPGSIPTNGITCFLRSG